VESETEDEQRDAALYRCVGLLKDSRLAAIRFYQLSVELFPLDRSTTFNLFHLQVGRYQYRLLVVDIKYRLQVLYHCYLG
jgi:hypothetical protein